MKKLGVGCLSFVIAIGILIAVVGFATSGVTGAANEFVEHVKNGKVEQAYQLCGGQLVEELPQERFGSFLRATRFMEVESASWTSRSVENMEGKVGGKITLQGGDQLPVDMVLKKIDGDWRIVGLHIEGAAPSKEAELPDEATSKKLVEAAMQSFGSYLKDKDRGPLESLASRSLIEQLSQEGALDGFLANFPDHKILGELLAQEVTLTNGPARSDEGTLLVEGRTPAVQAVHLEFKMTFVIQNKEWKLSFLDLNTKTE